MNDRILKGWIRERIVAKQVCKKAMDIATQENLEVV